MDDDSGIPAEVIEVIGVTGMHGEAMQIKCRILEGNNKGRIITRNSMGPINHDVLILLEGNRGQAYQQVKEMEEGAASQ